jgi:type IV pilus assembly protein PilA
MKRDSGFTLIELMIVVEIICVVAAIAIPNYVRARIQANEASAIGSLRTLLDAQVTYNTVHLEYAPDFDALLSASPPFLEGNWNEARNGYTFEMDGGVSNFGVSAVPVAFGQTGWRAFFVDASGQVRYRVNAEAGETDTVIGN